MHLHRLYESFGRTPKGRQSADVLPRSERGELDQYFLHHTREDVLIMRTIYEMTPRPSCGSVPTSGAACLTGRARSESVLAGECNRCTGVKLGCKLNCGVVLIGLSDKDIGNDCWD